MADYPRIQHRETQRDKAIADRRERDRECNLARSEESFEDRWKGDLGELAVKEWFEERGIEHWHITTNREKNPDFIVLGSGPAVGGHVAGYSVDVKTQGLEGPIKDHFDLRLLEDQFPDGRPKWDYYLWVFYSKDENVSTIVGGLSGAAFLEKAKPYGTGDKREPYDWPVHSPRRILRVSDVLPPQELLDEILQTNGGA